MVSEKRLKKAHPFAILSTLCMFVIDFGGIFDLHALVVGFACPIVGIVSNIIIIDLLRSYKKIYIFSIIQIVCYSMFIANLFYLDSFVLFIALVSSMMVGLIASIRVLQLIDL